MLINALPLYMRHFCCSLQPFCTLIIIDVCYALLIRLTRVKQSFLYMYSLSSLWLLYEYAFHPRGNSGRKSSSNFEQSRKQVTVLIECICLHRKVLLVTVFVCCFVCIQSLAQNLGAFKFWQLCTNASWVKKCFAVVQFPNPVIRYHLLCPRDR